MHNYLQELNIEYQNGYKKVLNRRNEWADFQSRAVDLLKQIASTGNKLTNEGKYYEFLYVLTQDDNMIVKKPINRGFIQFYAGQHPMFGIVDDTINIRTGQVTGTKSYIEKSGCLSIVQNPNGEVFFIVYASSSELIKWEDEYIVIKHFSTPSKIKYHHIKEAVEFYLRYAQITSYNCSPNLWDNIKISWIKFRFTSLLKLIPKGLGIATRIAIAVKTGIPIK